MSGVSLVAVVTGDIVELLIFLIHPSGEILFGAGVIDHHAAGGDLHLRGILFEDRVENALRSEILIGVPLAEIT